MLVLLLAAAPALAQQVSRTYSNIVINLVTSTNAVIFTDLQGHTYSNVTVKLIPYGLAWYAKDGSEGKLAIANLDDVTLADISGLSTNQVAYLIQKKAMEDPECLPQEATDSMSWWLQPYPDRLDEALMARPEYRSFVPPTMYWNDWLSDGTKQKELKRMQEQQARAIQEMQGRVIQEMRSFSPAPPAAFKR